MKGTQADMSKNKVLKKFGLKKQEVIRDWIELYNENIHDL
jgi:hypothetical protein